MAVDHKLKILNELKHRYSKRENIIKYLKSKTGEEQNSISDILISYDLQAGGYITAYHNNRTVRDLFCEELVKVFSELGHISSMLEAGVGEAVSLANLLRRMKRRPRNVYGFDLAWSRIKYGYTFLSDLGIDYGDYDNLQLFTGDMFSTPFQNNSVDVVFTIHAIEPNGGREKEALTELFRITRKYLVLLEPAYELADEQSKERMLSHGYVTSLYKTAIDLGYDVVEHRLFDVSLNPLNPTGLIIIRKEVTEEEQIVQDRFDDFSPLCCPLTHTALYKFESTYYSPESMLAYPILEGVPCLLPQNAIVATHFMDFTSQDKGRS